MCNMCNLIVDKNPPTANAHAQFYIENCTSFLIEDTNEISMFSD